MHSTEICVNGWKHVVIHHNGGWDGDYYISAWSDTDPLNCPQELRITDDNRVKDIVMHCSEAERLELVYAVGKAVGHAKLSAKLTNVIEQSAP